MKNYFLLFGLLLITLISCTTNDNDDLGITNSHPENLIAYYPFNGNSLNEVNLEHNGLVEGAILTSDMADIENSAFLFNGVDDVIKIDHDTVFNVSNAFTISALVNPQEIKTQGIIKKRAVVNGSGTLPYGISLSQTGDIVFTMTTENGETINQVRKQGYQTNAWYLITGVFKDSEMLLYVNGALEGSQMISGETTTNSEPLLIGSRLSLPSDTFKGTIDEVRIYNAALNATEVMTLYENL
jgi:hypothetical protein